MTGIIGAAFEENEPGTESRIVFVNSGESYQDETDIMHLAFQVAFIKYVGAENAEEKKHYERMVRRAKKFLITDCGLAERDFWHLIMSISDAYTVQNRWDELVIEIKDWYHQNDFPKVSRLNPVAISRLIPYLLSPSNPAIGTK